MCLCIHLKELAHASGDLTGPESDGVIRKSCSSSPKHLLAVFHLSWSFLLRSSTDWLNVTHMSNI